jgi:hypothetical protein
MLLQTTARLHQKRPILLIKEQVLVAHESHFAGGIHLFNCLAASLATSGLFEVHVHTTARKSLVMHHALSHGIISRLQSVKLPSELSNQQELLKWTSTEGIQFTVVVLPESSTADGSSAGAHYSEQAGAVDNSSSSSIDAAAAALVEAAAAAAAQLGQECLVLLDADRLQHVMVPASAHGCLQQQQQQQQSHTVPFMYVLAQQLKQMNDQQQYTHNPASQQQQQQKQQYSAHSPPKFLVLVQNLHHLPFGPCGCGPRTPAVLAAWQQLDAVLCVSQSVASYMQQHALHLLSLGSSSSSSRCASSSSEGAGSSRVFVVHPAALGAFGPGPFGDLGQTAAAKIWGHQETSIAAAQQQQQQQQQQWQQPPVIGMLKLSREKGSDLFFALAAALPQLQFVAVAADDAMQQAVAAAGLSNMQLLQPQADVEGVLACMDVLLVPSVLQEAFGLVVLDAMLRGIPGGLQQIQLANIDLVLHVHPV